MVSGGGNIVNFSGFKKKSREAKKQHDKAGKDAQAAANRVKFGRTGAEKKLSAAMREREALQHEGNRIVRPATSGDPGTGDRGPDDQSPDNKSD